MFIFAQIHFWCCGWARRVRNLLMHRTKKQIGANCGPVELLARNAGKDMDKRFETPAEGGEKSERARTVK